MIDAPGRKNSRFPPQKEDAVQLAIQSNLLKEQSAATEALIGIAGGACGGDILFHELCGELGIPTEMYLALPVAEFMTESVSFAGADWEARFMSLIDRMPVHILGDDIENESGGNVWTRVNLWMLAEGLKHGGGHMTLIALWDGKGGDGPGGTQHMVKAARSSGAKTEIVDINKL